MSGPDAAHVVELLIAEAWTAIRESRFRSAVAAADRAVAAAKETDDPARLARALVARSGARLAGAQP
jgi:hypothetical protein